jgi:hypothetical protein
MTRKISSAGRWLVFIRHMVSQRNRDPEICWFVESFLENLSIFNVHTPLL